VAPCNLDGRYPRIRIGDNSIGNVNQNDSERNDQHHLGRFTENTCEATSWMSQATISIRVVPSQGGHPVRTVGDVKRSAGVPSIVLKWHARAALGISYGWMSEKSGVAVGPRHPEHAGSTQIVALLSKYEQQV
jgi:hypothetical protein